MYEPEKPINLEFKKFSQYHLNHISPRMLSFHHRHWNQLMPCFANRSCTT